MKRPARLVLPLCFALVAIALVSCARPVVWQEREGAEEGVRMLVPTCPECGSVAEYDRDECVRCGTDYRFVPRPGEEE
ncbi:MAG: hypothetical protein HY720_20380 [Planctomycetes bacterium]|nr:hypothetical protein [Planctomycetota bacterium]